MRHFTFCAAILLLLSTPALARDVKVGDAAISVVTPAGDCELDTSRKADAAWLGSLRKLSEAAGSTLVAAFPDCKELPTMRTSDKFILNKVWITAYTPMIGKATAQSVEKTCGELRASGDKLTSDNFAQMKANAEKYTVNQLGESKFFGVIEEEKGQVCHSAQYFKIKDPKGASLDLLNIISALAIRSNLIFVYNSGAYVDGTSIPPALARSKVIYANLVEANAK